MTLDELATIFNRSLSRSFGIKKFLYLFFTLLAAGVVYLFFKGLASFATPWAELPLKFIPLFIAIALLLAVGTFLVHLYMEEKRTLKEVGETLLKASYLALPLLLAFLLFWVLIGLFLFLSTLPYVGPVLQVVLAFAPFLLNLGTLVLFLTALALFFFTTPHLAATGHLDLRGQFARLKQNVFINILLIVVAYLPVWFVWTLVQGAAVMTFELYGVEGSTWQAVVQAFFMLCPFVAILTPPITFFFNFAYEAYRSQLKMDVRG